MRNVCACVCICVSSARTHVSASRWILSYTLVTVPLGGVFLQNWPLEGMELLLNVGRYPRWQHPEVEREVFNLDREGAQHRHIDGRNTNVARPRGGFYLFIVMSESCLFLCLR